jgi:hypothetical protein
MSDLKNKIRQALAGSSGQQPVDTKTLLKLGSSDAVAAALDEMQASREINTALVITGGTQTVMCWLTGTVILNRSPQGIKPFGHILDMLTPPQRPDLVAKAPVQAGFKPTRALIPTPQPKEKRMGSNHPSPITLAIVEIVKSRPGIYRASLIEASLQHVKDSTEKQAKKALLNLIYISKKLRAEGERGNKSYFLNDGTKAQPVADSALPVVKTKPVKTKKVKAAKPAPASKSPTCPKKQVEALAPVGAGHARDPEFNIMLSESGNLHVSSGVATVVLTGDQQARLHRFIGRINLTGIT